MQKSGYRDRKRKEKTIKIFISETTRRMCVDTWKVITCSRPLPKSVRSLLWGHFILHRLKPAYLVQ